MEALGMIETKGLIGAIEAADGATFPDIDPAVIRAQCSADAVG